MASNAKVSTDDNTTKTWLGALMFGLLYPAVLGTFFYSLLPEAFALMREPGEFGALRLAKLAIALLLVLHFVFDFYFTQQVALEASRYSGKEFFFDLLIVISLFVAYETTHLGDKEVGGKEVEPEVVWVAGALCFSYVLFQIWERRMKPVIGVNLRLNIYEISAAIVFFLIALFLPRLDVLAVAIFVSAVCMFFIARPIVFRVRNELRLMHGNGESCKEGETANPAAPADQKAPLPGR